MSQLEQAYKNAIARNIRIDATRGKPGEEQIAIACDFLKPLDSWVAESGMEVRNYGLIDGLPEMRRLFASMLEVDADDVIVGDTSSLRMMFEFFSSMIHANRWQQGKSKFICPSPGFDRHFNLCEHLGIGMINVDMTPSGPDMDAVELYAQDPNIVGIWCVPLFSNPQGYIYSDETIARLACMKTANPDFRIIWDNAYIMHNFIGDRPKQLNIYSECIKRGHEDRPMMYTTFSKISIAGAAVACVSASRGNLEFYRRRVAAQCLGTDKVNQLRHVRYFKDIKGVEAHMQKHAGILRPMFEKSKAYLDEHLKDTNATFIIPKGGYFIPIKTQNGCAKKVWQLCSNAGLTLTPAGAMHPYGVDPNDAWLRLAPSCLNDKELDHALEVLCISIKLAEGELLC